MTTWNQPSAMQWFRRHAGQKVVLRQHGSTLRLSGQLHGVDEIDACSTDVYEAELELEGAPLHAALSLHEHSLMVHLLGRVGAAEERLSIPLSIPYPELVLTEPAAAEPEEPDGGRSPYELLH